MNKVTICGILISKNYQQTKNGTALNLLVTDRNTNRSVTFKTVFWNKQADQLGPRLEKGMLIKLNGFISGTERNDKGDLIVIGSPEVLVSNWINIVKENNTNEDTI